MIERFSHPRLFGWDKIDPASALLADCFKDTVRGDLADFGSGYGFLAESALSFQENLRSLVTVEAEQSGQLATQMNVERHNPKISCSFLWEDVTRFSKVECFDCIVMNPPFHCGGENAPELGVAFLEKAHLALRSGGTLLVVFNRHLPYRTHLKRLFPNYQERASNSRFVVIEATKPL